MNKNTFKRQWTKDTKDVRKNTPYVLVKHRRNTRLSYFLNRDYELIWLDGFNSMLPTEEEGLKKFLFRVFATHKVQTTEGWTPTYDTQKPEKVWGIHEDNYTAYWLDDYTELNAATLSGLMFVGDTIGEAETVYQITNG